MWPDFAKTFITPSLLIALWTVYNVPQSSASSENTETQITSRFWAAAWLRSLAGLSHTESLQRTHGGYSVHSPSGWRRSSGRTHQWAAAVRGLSLTSAPLMWTFIALGQPAKVSLLPGDHPFWYSYHFGPRKLNSFKQTEPHPAFSCVRLWSASCKRHSIFFLIFKQEHNLFL